MTVQIRLLALPLLLAAATVAGCGDSSTGSGDASPAARHAAAEKIIAQATGVNRQARSGRIDGSVKVQIKGIPRFEGPIELTANGVFNLPDGASVPDVDIDVGASLNSGVLGGAIVVADGKGYIKLGNAGYKLPDAISKVLVAPARDAKNGLTKTGAMFYINPHDWQKNARVVGEESIAGESTQRITADVLPDRAFADLAHLVHFLTLIHVTQALGVPEEFTPKMQAALVRSVSDVHGTVWMGTDDHVLRQARVTGKVRVAKRDRKVLLGATSGTLQATINVSQVGDPQEISAPTQLDSYANLQLSLDALAEAALRQARRSRGDR
jgi:hypothetical protein